MTTAIVLSGGGNLGAVQVGMLQALADRGVRPDLLVGTSVGAINAAYVATDFSPATVDGLAELWKSVHRRDVFPARPLIGLLGFAGRRNHLVPNSALRQLLERHLRFRRLEDAPIELHVIATDVVSGTEVVLSTGDTIDAILASAAIPGVFPTVPIAGRELMDGGTVNDTPISRAATLGATKIYALPTGYSCDLDEPPDSALGMVLHGVNVLATQRLVEDIGRYRTKVDLSVVPPPCPIEVSPVDFTRSAELIDQARRTTQQWLDAGRTAIEPAQLLHRH